MTISKARALAAGLLAVVLVVILGLAGLAVYQWGRASAQRDASDISNEVQSCRASFRSDLLDGPVIDGLAAVALGDGDAVAAAANRADRAEYDRLNVLSREEPDAFLRLCEAAYG